MNEEEKQAVIVAAKKYTKNDTGSMDGPFSDSDVRYVQKASFIAGAEFLAELRKPSDLLSAQMFLAGKLEAEKDSAETINDLRSALGDIQGEMTDKALAFAEWTCVCQLELIKDYSCWEDIDGYRRTTEEHFNSTEFETYYQNHKSK